MKSILIRKICQSERRRRLHLILFFLLISISAFAQPHQNKEKIESMKVGFITQKLNLTSEEAQKFWPVYNQFQDEMEKLRKTRRDERKDAREDFDQMNDKQIESLVDGEIIYEQKELDIKKKYHAQFKQVLPIKKVAMLYKAERDFKKMLLEKMKERRDAAPHRKPGLR